MDLRVVWALIGKELRECHRNRWVVVLALVFGGLALAFSLLGRAGLGTVGVSGFGRTAASLVSLVVLLVPLLGLILGAGSVAGDRERGTLLMLLAQPVTTGEVLLGKFLGAAGALAIAVLAGFGVSGVVIAREAGWAHVALYARLMGLTLALGAVYLSIGLCISTLARRSAGALGLAVVVWLLSTFVADLLLMGSSIVLRLTPGQLLWASLSNPAQLFRLGVMQTLHGNLELLGAAGVYASTVLGSWVPLVVLGLCACWIAGMLGAAYGALARRGAL